MGRLEKAATLVRTRNRITNRTKLRIVLGDVSEAEVLYLEEDSDKHKILDVAGVEHEDARVSDFFLRSLPDAPPASPTFSPFPWPLLIGWPLIRQSPKSILTRFPPNRKNISFKVRPPLYHFKFGWDSHLPK